MTGRGRILAVADTFIAFAILHNGWGLLGGLLLRTAAAVFAVVAEATGGLKVDIAENGVDVLAVVSEVVPVKFYNGILIQVPRHLGLHVTAVEILRRLAQPERMPFEDGPAGWRALRVIVLVIVLSVDRCEGYRGQQETGRSSQARDGSHVFLLQVYSNENQLCRIWLLADSLIRQKVKSEKTRTARAPKPGVLLVLEGGRPRGLADASVPVDR
jgi:hypothetical protein